VPCLKAVRAMVSADMGGPVG